MVKCRIILCDVPDQFSLEGREKMVRIPRAGDRREPGGFLIATDDAEHLAHEAGALLEQAVGVGWYDAIASEADLAAFVLCRLRRAGAGAGGAMEHGDAAVRATLEQASPAALAWIASRAISYMDESGYPESVESWFPETMASRSDPGATQDEMHSG
jgi:hypothetical protein